MNKSMNENEGLSIDKIIENLYYIHPLVTISLTRSIRASTNLNPGSLYIMGLLSRNEMMSMSEIGCKLKIPKPHVTSQIDKLIAENFVERLNDPNDRRVINIRLTDKGKVDFQKMKQAISQEMRQRIETLDQQNIKAMLNSTQQLRDILTEIMKDTSCEKPSCND